MKHIPAASFRGIAAVRAESVNMAEINAVIAKLNTGFEEFKAANDKAITDKFKDVVQADKVDRINADITKLQSAVDETNSKLAALALSSDGDNDVKVSPELKAYSKSFNAWVRDGANETEIKAANRAGGIMAAMSVGSNPDGGFTAPVEWDRTITDKLKQVSPMRQFASTQSVSGQGFKKLYNKRGTASGWVGETAARPATNSSQFAEYAFSFGEIYANPAVTQQILEDSEIDIAAFVGSEVNVEFDMQEGTAFITGDGVNKPKGIMQYTAALEGALAVNLQHPLGPILEVNSGNAALLTPDGLISLSVALPMERRDGAAFYANSGTIAAVRKFKDTTNNYLWQPSNQVGQPASLLGYGSNELSGLPDVAANAMPVLFGNMAQTYRIFDRRGIALLRDPYTNKPYVHFYMTKRVGGGLWNPEWMRYHKVAI